jgi:uncharacterized protein (DUF3084 family)
MDPLAQVALIGVPASLLTIGGSVFVTIVNSKKERVGAAENALEKALRERLLLRDETIAELRADLAERDKDVADRAAVIEQRDVAIAARDALIEEYRRDKGREAADGTR